LEWDGRTEDDELTREWGGFVEKGEVAVGPAAALRNSADFGGQQRVWRAANQDGPDFAIWHGLNLSFGLNFCAPWLLTSVL
jgi:hypothetical protein